MSANDQVIVAPFPENLDKYAVWHDGCVDNPFNFSAKPLNLFGTLEEAIAYAEWTCDKNAPVEYGIRIIRRASISGYQRHDDWDDEFPNNKYLGPKFVEAPPRDYAAGTGGETLFNDGTLAVWTNGCGEIFVTQCSDDLYVRITPQGGVLSVTSHDGVLTPWSTNGLPAFQVRRKK